MGRPQMGRPQMGRSDLGGGAVQEESAGYSLHVGLNAVDEQVYGWAGQLKGCEADAKSMYAVAGEAGFAASDLLLGPEATAGAVLARLADAAQIVQPGDLFVLTYSGHGGQLPDQDGDEPGDHLDETWILYDRMLLDDELRLAFTAFAPGVRIVVVADCCHNGADGERVIPQEVAGKHLGEMLPTYRGVQLAAKHSEPQASVLSLCASQENQEAADGDRNGRFTAALLSIWNKNGFDGDYLAFHGAIAEKLPRKQQPDLRASGGGDIDAFREQRPFTVVPPQGWWGYEEAGAGGVSYSVDGGRGAGGTVTVTVTVDLG